MADYSLNFLKPGEIKIFGYPKTLFNYIVDNQLNDPATWELLANQFKLHTDVDNNWRGEFWGKLMRGATFSYRLCNNSKLYKTLTESVKMLMSCQEESGRISTYPLEKEFNGWDMWARKYVMLGLLNYYDICKSNAFKKKVLKCVRRHADYIVSHIGNGKNKKDIFETSGLYGCLNSSSILEPFVKLYKVSGVNRYLSFASYLVNKGLCKNFNIINQCLTKDKFPYQFPVNKAYEMMSCFEGLLEYYLIKGNEDYLKSVINYADLIYESDFTIIGCSGCNGEHLDNSSFTQTEYTGKIMQETCVTVTFMNLCLKLYRITKDVKYIDWMERSIYNALYGAVNNEHQTMENVNGYVWVSDPPLVAKHEAWAFDSYSPLVYSRRGITVGGFMVLQNDRSYGCCACNGACGTAVSGLLSVMKCDEGYYLNLFNKMKIKDENITIDVSADVYSKEIIKINISSKEKTKVFIRIPKWFDEYKIFVNEKEEHLEIVNGYVELNQKFENTFIKIAYKAPVKVHVLNNKISFSKGPIILARDNRFEDIKAPVLLNKKDGATVRAKKIQNNKFKSNICLRVKTKNGDITLVDYSQAGKNFDDVNSMITVWQEQQ